jgi:hypothetical protein
MKFKWVAWPIRRKQIRALPHSLRERIETHGELARRDYEAAWTMYESGLRSKAEIDAVKEKDAAEKRLSAALRIKA